MSELSCIFCKIVKGEIPGKKIYEDDDFYAFHDIHPLAPVHALVIPKQHIETLADCSADHAPMLGKMMVLTAQLATELGTGYDRSAEGDTGFRTVINVGPQGGQEVYHLHAHILGGPRPWSRMG